MGSDLSRTKIIDDSRFIEYTKEGYGKTFSVTVIEPHNRWEFDMENSNMKGHWVGVFTSLGSKTQIDFTENITPKKWFMKPFVMAYLKKVTKTIYFGLKKTFEQLRIMYNLHSSLTLWHKLLKRYLVRQSVRMGTWRGTVMWSAGVWALAL